MPFYYKYFTTKLLVTAIVILFLSSCKKLVSIPPPTNTITTSQAFFTDALATEAMLGVYHKMINTDGTNFCNGAITIYTGTSSDELEFFQSSVVNNDEFQSNALSSNNGIVYSSFWSNGFSIIYSANSVIEGLKSSLNVHDSVKNELIGEAKFVRAFCNFYLCNLFGDIPIVTETNWRNTKTFSRSSISEVYKQIISDLKDAQSQLSADFSVGHGQKIIPNKWAATALLARVYLYMEDWHNAEIQANSVISEYSHFSINSDLNDVFKTNSLEAIWQLQQSNISYPYNATNEGFRIIPLDGISEPFIYLSDYLLSSFEPDDKRKEVWIDSTVYSSSIYLYPKKYQIGASQAVPNGLYTEYYMVLRLAEQYLIRAEAKAMQNKLTEAVNDINIIRQRAGLPSLSSNLSQEQVLNAIEQERKVEFFAEWGHRWFDLKRWNKADAELGIVKGSNWQTTDQLYPIPVNDLLTNPNLTQNPGY